MFIFEPHNLAPFAWNLLRRGAEGAPALITLDRHTDTHLAFLRYLFAHHHWSFDTPPYDRKIDQAIAECAKIRTDADLEGALQRLRNDEHIDFAMRMGFLSHAYVVSHQTNPQFVMRSRERQAWDDERFKLENVMQRIVPPRPDDRIYDMPENRIICLGNDHLYELGANTEQLQIDLSLDDMNLRRRMHEIDRINACVVPNAGSILSNFILDIDLDYFNTWKSINPDAPGVFYELIRRCVGMTIAKESDFVLDCRLEGESVTSDMLLARLRQHIEAAQR